MDFKGDKNLSQLPSEGKSVPCRKVLRHVKGSYEYERDNLQAKFSSHFSPSLSVCAGKLPEELWWTNKK
jgi:hypothetical protein